MSFTGQPLSFVEWGREQGLQGQILDTPEGRQQLALLQSRYDEYVSGYRGNAFDDLPDLVTATPPRIQSQQYLTDPSFVSSGVPAPDEDFNSLVRPLPTNTFENLPEPPAASQPQPQATDLDYNGLAGVLTQRQLDLKRLPGSRADKSWNTVNQDLLERFVDSSEPLSQFGIYDVETFDALAREPNSVSRRAISIAQQDISRGVAPDWDLALKTAKAQTTQEGEAAEQRLPTIARTVKDFTDSAGLLLERNPELAARIDKLGQAQTSLAIGEQLLESPEVLEKMVVDLEKLLSQPADKKDSSAVEAHEESRRTVLDVVEQTYLQGLRGNTPSAVVPLGANLTDDARYARIVEAGDRNATLMIENEDGTVRSTRMTPESSATLLDEIAKAKKAKALQTDEGNPPENSSYVLRGLLELGKMGVTAGTGAAKLGGAVIDRVGPVGQTKRVLKKFNIDPKVMGELESFITDTQPARAAAKLSMAAITALDRIGRAATATEEDEEEPSN